MGQFRQQNYDIMASVEVKTAFVPGFVKCTEPANEICSEHYVNNAV
jgi:hypothetical protein